MRTDKILGAVALCLVLAPPVSAQPRVGFVGGANRADLDTYGDPVVRTLTRLALGGVVDLGLGEQLGIRLEPMYIQKGGKFEATEDPSSRPPGRLEASFLEIPVLLKLSVGDRVKPYLLAGPAIGLRLSEDIELNLADQTYAGDMKDTTDPLDVGLVFGAGVGLPLGSADGFLECRYTLGLSNRMKGGLVLVTGPAGTGDINFDQDDDKFKTRGLQILVGLTFPLGGR